MEDDKGQYRLHPFCELISRTLQRTFPIEGNWIGRRGLGVPGIPSTRSGAWGTPVKMAHASGETSYGASVGVDSGGKEDSLDAIVGLPRKGEPVGSLTLAAHWRGQLTWEMKF